MNHDLNALAEKARTSISPLSDADYSFDITALNTAKRAIGEAHKAFIEAARRSASSETRDLLYDHCDQLSDILSDLNGQRTLVRESYNAPMPPRVEEVS